MGESIHYTCGKCGNTEDPCLGIGMAFPSVYRELMDEIRQGRHGEEWRSLVESGEHIAIDGDEKLYACETCGHWEVEPDLSLYEPKDVAKLLEKLTEQFGEERVAEWGGAPYVMSWELEEDYKLLKHREHRCPDCGGAMNAFDDFESAPNVKCPKCGGEMTPGPGLIKWD